GGLQVAGNSSEVLFFQVEMRVGLTHVSATVVIGAAKGDGQESFLFVDLAFHVYIVEKLTDGWVCQYFSVENIHGGIDGSSATQFVIQAHTKSPACWLSYFISMSIFKRASRIHH